MIELKTLKDCISKRAEINFLPLQVQAKITEILEMLDEAYGTGDSRIFEGGKVIVLEDEQEALNIHQRYNLRDNEFVEILQENYLFILIPWGTENNIAIISKEKWVKQFIN
nr:hypothetical protein [uncultured Cellulosilyticum sp.]